MIGKYPVTDPSGDDGRVAIVRAIRDKARHQGSHPHAGAPGLAQA
jgi:hypothetical protein